MYVVVMLLFSQMLEGEPDCIEIRGLLAFSPSYFLEYQDNNNDNTFNSIYMNSSRVQLGVKFGCAIA
jgi:hypothetical protein